MITNSFTFTPTTTGEYHIGFYTTTPVQCSPGQNDCCLYVDNIQIQKI